MFAKSKAKGGAKLKEPKVPTKGEKTKKAPKASITARATPANLSEEFIQDTDKEDGGDGASTAGSSSGHDADSASEEEARMNTKKPKMERAKKTEPEEVPVPDDTSDEDGSGESEDEEEDESSAEEELKEVEVNGKKRKAESNGKDNAPEAKKQKKASKAEAKASASNSEEGDDPVQKKTNPKSTAPAAPTTQHSTKPIPSLPFKPPPGYSPLSTTDTPAALTPHSIAEKQIWHITAPSSVPLASISSVALDAIQTGKPVLTHAGADYILAEDAGPTSTSTTLFLPGGEGYLPSETKVQRTLHLQQKITLPNLSAYQADPATAGSAAAADVATAPVRGPKPQPKGLRMRYRPIGHVSGKPGIIGSDDGSEEEQETAPAPAKKNKKSKKEAGKEGVQFPKTLGANGVSEAEVAANGMGKAASPVKKGEKANEKKKRKSKDAVAEEKAEPAAAAASVAEQPSWSFDAISGKPEQDAKQGAEDADVTMADMDDTVVTNGDAGEIKEEKAKRKEERKALREKKAARKAKRESGAA